MDKTFIRVKNLSFRYEENENNVINSITFDIKKGEYVSIVGHNGSGKSTLAKLLNAILIPSSGRVEIEGQDTKHSSEKLNIRKKVGVVFQNPDNQLVATLVEEDVAFAPENLGMPRDEMIKRIDYALDAVDMLEYKNKSTHQLSGGQKQRVAIAGILAMNPLCIIFDEATSMLDPKGRQDILSIIKKLNTNHKKTIINITHYMEESALADRIIVMNDGKIALDGTPHEVFSRAEYIKSIGLQVPEVTKLGYELNRLGVVKKQIVVGEDECLRMLEQIMEDK